MNQKANQLSRLIPMDITSVQSLALYIYACRVNHAYAVSVQAVSKQCAGSVQGVYRQLVRCTGSVHAVYRGGAQGAYRQCAGVCRNWTVSVQELDRACTVAHRADL